MTSPTRSAGAVFAYASKGLSDADYAVAWLAHIRTRCIVTARGCWEWQGFRHPAEGTRQLPYGEASYRGKAVRLHRKMLELKLGHSLPRELQACHECDNPPCCNPEHLYSATNQQNHLDGGSRGRMQGQWKTECKHGHPFNEENTYWSPRPNGRPVRNCKACQRVWQRDRYRKQREKRQETQNV